MVHMGFIKSWSYASLQYNFVNFTEYVYTGILYSIKYQMWEAALKLKYIR